MNEPMKGAGMTILVILAVIGAAAIFLFVSCLAVVVSGMPY
jgi:hypothetical protein